MNVKQVHKTYMSFCDVGIVILHKKHHLIEEERKTNIN